VKGSTPHSNGAVELGTGSSQPFSLTSSVSKAQLGYSRRAKEKVAKQLNKNKEMLVEIVVDIPVEGVEACSKTVNFASVMGMSWGGDDKKLLDLFSIMDKREPKVKGLRELKNLDCSISLVKCQHRRGVDGVVRDVCWDFMAFVFGAYSGYLCSFF
jgi:hypothetical protein